MSIETFRDRLADLGRHLELALEPNEFNVCSLALDEAQWIHISYSDQDSQVHWTRIICSTMLVDGASIYPALLAANLDWQMTQGGFFAFDESTEVVVFRFHEPASGLHTQRFIEQTELFIRVSGFWHERLQKAVARLREAPKAEPAAPARDGLSLQDMLAWKA